MKINPVSSNSNQSIYYQKKKSVKNKHTDHSTLQYFLPNYQNYHVSFGNNVKKEAVCKVIEKTLKSEYAITADFAGSNLVAECVNKTVNLFKSLFGRSYLPNNVGFAPLREIFPPNQSTEGILGIHFSDKKTGNDYIVYNSDESCFNSKLQLKICELESKIHSFHPTGHYLQTFVHEFGHSAHYKNLCHLKRESLMDDFSKMKFDNILERFITIFKLGEYSATNMNEFMAERITKDICSNLDGDDKFVGNKDDLDYSFIFTARWGNVLSTPQSFLDLMTQQIWNGQSVDLDDTFEKLKVCVLIVEDARDKLAFYNNTIVKYYKYLSNPSLIEKDVEKLKATEDYKDVPEESLKKIVLFNVYNKIQESIDDVLKISLGRPVYKDKYVDDIPFLNEFYKNLVAQEARKNGDKRKVIEQLMKYEYKTNFFESPAVVESVKKEIKAIYKSIEKRKITEMEKKKLKLFFTELADRISSNIQKDRELLEPGKEKKVLLK